ncbi:unnamed protein product [Auanema sp. JU1783]|nr:unnamed protein product [Auanema sp. JU1783]
MASIKAQYDAVKCRERVRCGGFRFVIPCKNFVVPKFKCCGGKHSGADIEYKADNFCLNNDVVAQTPLPPIKRPGPSSHESYEANSTNFRPAIQPPPSATSSFNRVNSYDNNACNSSFDTPNVQSSALSRNSFRVNTSFEHAPISRPVIIEDRPMDDVVDESDAEEIMFCDDPRDDPKFQDDSFDNDDIPITEDKVGDVTMAGQFGFPADMISSTSAASTNITANDSFDECDIVVGDLPSTSSSKATKVSTERHDMHGQFRGFLKDDSEEFEDEVAVLGQFRRDELYDTLKAKFGFNSFRHRQKTAIISILSGHDAFVLMPTGAGKSLCYQLPAVLSEGVTVVVSPLKSLIEDQKFKMKELDIPCEAFTSELTLQQQDIIYQKLTMDPPLVKLLYVTPEKISASPRLATVFSTLHKRNHLARFVIDEAHCVSQWGHDFRPDYTKLTSLRRDYAVPRVPIVALTATATPKIVTDTRNHLAIPQSKLFISSFVRTNLKYDIVPKAAKTLVTMIERLKQLYPGKSGIVYCLSRKECETIAASLTKNGMSADVYHAGLDDKKRIAVQHRWLGNRVDVICATIAFGMGIDKPDVRFVIHYSLPKSIEGYYQETGRAGRDGLPSYCVMLYSYCDSVRLRKMVEMDDSTVGVRSMHLNSIYQVVAYCENISICRRKQLVEHFGEVYDAQACFTSSTPCDVCEKRKKDPESLKLFDYSDEATLILKSLDRMGNVTLKYLSELYRGQMQKKTGEQAMRLGHTNLGFYGRGASMSDLDALRFIRKMVVDGYIFEKLFTTRMDLTVAYAQLTDKGRAISKGQATAKVFLHINTSGNKRKSFSTDGLRITAVSEARALKEKHMVKHADIFQRCLRALQNLITQIAEENNLPGSTSIISREGIEQIAALLPRTNSDLLQADTMTANKVEKYGPRIMSELKPYWLEIDARDTAEIHEQLEKLKQREEVMGGFACIPSQPVSSQAPRVPVSRFRGKFGRGGGRGKVGRATPRPRKKGSGGSSQTSQGTRRATRGARAQPKAAPGLNPMLFPF